MISPPAVSLRFSEQDVADFAAASGDRNPLHLDADYARRTAYGQRLVHGMAAALACLKHLPKRRGRYPRRLELECRNPIFLHSLRKR